MLTYADGCRRVPHASLHSEARYRQERYSRSCGWQCSKSCLINSLSETQEFQLFQRLRLRLRCQGLGTVHSCRATKLLCPVYVQMKENVLKRVCKTSVCTREYFIIRVSMCHLFREFKRQGHNLVCLRPLFSGLEPRA